MNPNLLTAKDVALILRISPTKAYQLLKLKKIPTISFGRNVRVREEDLNQFILTHREDESDHE